MVATAAAVTAGMMVLLPALGELRRQGKAAVCLANLARLADASQIHAAADPNENAIPIHELAFVANSGGRGEYEWGGKSGAGEPIAGPTALYSKWGTAEGRGPATRPLNRIIYGDVFADHANDPGNEGANWIADSRLDLPAYRCPSDYGYTGHHFLAWRDSKLTSYDHYGNSYTANTSWIGIAGANCRFSSNSAFARPISRVPVPAMTLLYSENSGRFGWRANYGSAGDGGCSGIPGMLGADVQTNVRGWHGQMWMFQVAFVDGHAGLIRMEGHQQPEPQLGKYPPFNGHPTEHNFWKCVIFRGPGWQLDTLPAPPIPTEFPCFSNPSAHPIG